jgi:hypothetical protein
MTCQRMFFSFSQNPKPKKTCPFPFSPLLRSIQERKRRRSGAVTHAAASWVNPPREQTDGRDEESGGGAAGSGPDGDGGAHAPPATARLRFPGATPVVRRTMAIRRRLVAGWAGKNDPGAHEPGRTMVPREAKATSRERGV